MIKTFETFLNINNEAKIGDIINDWGDTSVFLGIRSDATSSAPLLYSSDTITVGNVYLEILKDYTPFEEVFKFTSKDKSKKELFLRLYNGMEKYKMSQHVNTKLELVKMIDNVQKIWIKTLPELKFVLEIDKYNL